MITWILLLAIAIALFIISYRLREIYDKTVEIRERQEFHYDALRVSIDSCYKSLLNKLVILESEFKEADSMHWQRLKTIISLLEQQDDRLTTINGNINSSYNDLELIINSLGNTIDEFNTCLTDSVYKQLIDTGLRLQDKTSTKAEVHRRIYTILHSFSQFHKTLNELSHE